MKSYALMFLLSFLAAITAPIVMAHGGAKDHPNSESKEYGEQLDFGRVGKYSEVARTINVNMTDAFRFVPEALQIRKGETVRLVFYNVGAQVHEWVFGTPEEIKKHAKLMKRFPNMEHDEPHMVHVVPGKKSTLVWQFNRSGKYHFACLLPGHFEAGMKGKVKVQ